VKGEYNKEPPSNVKTCIKNTIKLNIGDPLLILLKSIDPIKNLRSPTLGFSTLCIFGSKVSNESNANNEKR
jgi:hypothetical protein